MTVALIVAATKEGHIGNDNALSWFLPSDLKWFKTLTSNNMIVMGRKTFESIGKPLPNRINHVISKTLAQKEGIKIFSSVDEWKEQNKEIIYSVNNKIFIIGGSEIYRQLFSLVDEIYFSELSETINQKKVNVFDKKIDFSPKSLIDSNQWFQEEKVSLLDEKSYFKNDNSKENIFYERYVLKKYNIKKEIV